MQNNTGDSAIKLVRFLQDGKGRAGVLVGHSILDVSQHAPELADLDVLLTQDGRAKAAELSRKHGPTIALESARLLAPLSARSRIFCVGVNYKSHLDETGRDMPTRPSTFLRTHESLVDPDTPLRLPKASSRFDYEGELAAVIGMPARNVSEEKALGHVAGYCCFNDGSVRDYQKFSVTAGKNFEASGSCGPWIVTADEIPDPTALTLVTRLNGQQVQRSQTSLLIYSVPLILSFLSEITELRPGDIVATGTPAGVGHRRDPQLWMKKGDVVEVEISGIGVLLNMVDDQP